MLTSRELAGWIFVSLPSQGGAVRTPLKLVQSKWFPSFLFLPFQTFWLQIAVLVFQEANYAGSFSLACWTVSLRQKIQSRIGANSIHAILPKPIGLSRKSVKSTSTFIPSLQTLSGGEHLAFRVAVLSYLTFWMFWASVSSWVQLLCGSTPTSVAALFSLPMTMIQRTKK